MSFADLFPTRPVTPLLRRFASLLEPVTDSALEAMAAERGLDLEKMTLVEMDLLWDEVKKRSV